MGRLTIVKEDVSRKWLVCFERNMSKASKRKLSLRLFDLRFRDEIFFSQLKKNKEIWNTMNHGQLFSLLV